MDFTQWLSPVQHRESSVPEPAHPPAGALETVSTEGTFITWFLMFPLHKAQYWPGMGFSVAVEQDQGRGACLYPLDGC